MSLHESGEMYLETIYVLSKQHPSVRSIDVCEHLGYSKPSVSRAMSILKKGGYVVTNEDGHLLLTESGRAIAEKTYERHNVLSTFFELLGVDDETASEDACKIEHVISDTTFEAIKKLTAEYKKGNH